MHDQGPPTKEQVQPKPGHTTSNTIPAAAANTTKTNHLYKAPTKTPILRDEAELARRRKEDCRHFLRNGHCRNGNLCDYKHPVRTEENSPKRPGVSTRASSAATTNHDNNTREPDTKRHKNGE